MPAHAARSIAIAALILIACQGSAAAPAPAVVTPTGPVMDQVRALLQADEQQWIGVRRDLHRHPELSGNEVRTSQLIASQLRALGLEVRTGVGGHGVAALLRGARPGPLIAYRADMDAMPSTARDPVDFPSVTNGVRHICGHDIHTTIGLALASVLHAVRDSIAGSVLFVFQPAEERATGAKAMLADGVFAPLQPQAIYGLHTSPYEVGRLGTTPGPMMAGRDRFDVALSGSGNLAAAASAVSQAIAALGTVDASQINGSQSTDFVFVQLNPPQTGASQVHVQGTISVASAASRARVRGTIEHGLQGVVPSGVTVTASYEARWIAGVTNDTALTASAMAAVRGTLGDAAMATLTSIPGPFSEDFGSFQEQVPGTFFFLGVANAARGWNGQPHSPDYVADERSIGTGALAMAAVLLNRMSAEPSREKAPRLNSRP
ncbi:MAG: M20 family metallopeptidase [Gemmatimonadaceae bacterium]